MLNKAEILSLVFTDEFFQACIYECMRADGYVENWARLRGVKLPSSPIEQMIDHATGFYEGIGELFVTDVYEMVYSRVLKSVEPPILQKM